MNAQEASFPIVASGTSIKYALDDFHTAHSSRASVRQLYGLLRPIVQVTHNHSLLAKQGGFDQAAKTLESLAGSIDRNAAWLLLQVVESEEAKEREEAETQRMQREEQTQNG